MKRCCLYCQGRQPLREGEVWTYEQRHLLDALVGAAGVEGAEGRLGGNVSVEHEVYTDAGNRIDLLIKSESRAMLIENKIFAAVANPFDDYAAYLSFRSS
jgi:hypothetical protein